MTPVTLRAARREDLDRITEIYRPYVTDTILTFEETAPPIQEMTQRFEDIKAQDLPYCVLCLKGEVIGYGYIRPFHQRCAYRYTVEHSIYLDRAHVKQGYGAPLLEHLIKEARTRKLHQLVAVIAGNTPHASHRLHEKFGFQHVGVLKKCGFKFGQWIDVTYMQKELA